MDQDTRDKEQGWVKGLEELLDMKSAKKNEEKSTARGEIVQELEMATLSEAQTEREDESDLRDDIPGCSLKPPPKGEKTL